MLLEKLSELFRKSEIPNEVKSVFKKAKTTRDLLKGLDEIMTRNELAIDELTREAEKLESIEAEDIAKLKSGALNERQRRRSLQRIKRIRNEIENLDGRIAIHDKNLSLHSKLIAKIQDMEAMELRGVEEEQIDQIILDFETNFESYASTVAGDALLDEATSSIKSEDDEELAQLEAEILGDGPQSSRKTRTEEKSATDERQEIPELPDDEGGTSDMQRAKDEDVG